MYCQIPQFGRQKSVQTLRGMVWNIWIDLNGANESIQSQYIWKLSVDHHKSTPLLNETSGTPNGFPKRTWQLHAFQFGTCRTRKLTAIVDFHAVSPSSVLHLYSACKYPPTGEGQSIISNYLDSGARSFQFVCGYNTRVNLVKLHWQVKFLAGW